MQQTAINLISSTSPSQMETNFTRGKSQEKFNQQNKEKKLLNYERMKFKTDIKQDGSQNDYQLAKSYENLKQQLQGEQKIFVKKELQLQEQILQEQQAFDKKLKFLNFQYQTKINDLQWELKMKDQEIQSLNLQLSNFNLSRISEKLYQSQSSSSQKSNDIVKNFHIKLPQRSYKKEKKCQYQNELKRIRIQTAQFAEKFITEKNQISEDLEQLKQQKLMLQQLFQNKKVIKTDRLFYESTKTMNIPNNNQRKKSSSFGANIESQIQLDI